MSEDRKVKSPYRLFIFHETQRAWQVGKAKADRENNNCFWLPKSQCKVDHEITDKSGIWMQVQIPLWLAEEKGLDPSLDAVGDYQDGPDDDVVDDGWETPPYDDDEDPYR